MKSKPLVQFIAAFACSAWVALSTASAQTTTNTKFRSLLSLSGSNGEVAVAGNYACVARDSAGLAIIDVTSPTAPVLRATALPFAHAHFSDVQVVGNLAYVSNEVPNGTPPPHVGMFIYDVSNPLAPVEVSRLTWGAGGGYHLGCDAHSVTVDTTTAGTYAYLSSGITGDVAIFDVSNPAVPVYVSQILSPIWSYNSRSHDVLVRGGRAYITWLGGGFTIHDVSNPAAPVQLAHKATAGINSEFFYHVALSADGQTLLTAGEQAGASSDPVRLWNISNLAAITQVGAVVSPGGAVPHQLVVDGKYAYIAWLTDGLRVIDISTPSAPRLVAQYDPEAGSGTSWIGGVSVAVAGNNVYLSHTSNGLYTVDFVDTISVVRAEWQKFSKRLVIEATSTAAPSPTLSVTGYGVMTYNTSTGRYTRTVNSVFANPGTVTLTSDIGASRSASVQRVNQ